MIKQNNLIKRELYFQSYEFFNFKDFFRLFLNFFEFLFLKFKKYEKRFFTCALMWLVMWHACLCVIAWWHMHVPCGAHVVHKCVSLVLSALFKGMS